LHQLRRRVIRGTHQPYCYLYAESNGEKARERLRAMTTAPNGFALAEMDLALRGAGELSGAKQWGISDIGMEAIKNLRMVEAARHEAGALLDRDPTLAEHPIIEGALAARTAALHFE
jgi:ATP-dependent DNA helicase RecG